jgi:hypothetical protein
MKKKTPKPAPPPQHIVNMGVSALAREVGMTPAAISQKMKAGKTPDQIRQEAAQRQGRAPKVTSKAKGNSRGPGRPPLASEYDLVIKGRQRLDAIDEMKLRRAKALAERQELENAFRRGELIPASYVRQWGVRFITAAKDELLRGPSELQDLMATEADPQKCNAIMRAWVERVVAKVQELQRLWKTEFEAEEVA